MAQVSDLFGFVLLRILHGYILMEYPVRYVSVLDTYRIHICVLTEVSVFCRWRVDDMVLDSECCYSVR
jgi:hypothetical protein